MQYFRKFILLLIPLFLLSCDKLQFSSTGFATLKYTNQSEDCYKIYLEDKELKELRAHESHEVRVSAGHLYRLKAVQSTGVSGFPQVFETSIAIEFGTKEFAFPL